MDNDKKNRPISLINVEFNNSFNKTRKIKEKDPKPKDPKEPK